MAVRDLNLDAVVVLKCFTCLLCLLCLNGFAQGELAMVLIVHRHGARTRLSKDSKTLAESQSTLTDEGIQQLRRLGTEVRLRYLRRPECQATETCLDGDWTTYRHDGWYAISSSTDRTLTSAVSFQLGVLPPTMTAADVETGELRVGTGGGFQPVPIYSTPSENDFLLRAYTDQKCPTYLSNLNNFYRSPEFLAKQQETRPLLDAINKQLEANYTLLDIFNIYDAQNVQPAFGAGTSGGGARESLLSNDTYTQVAAAADWLEWHRYAVRDVAGDLLGGALLADIVRRIDAGAGARFKIPTPITPGPCFVEYSSHYPSMMGLLAAIGIGNSSLSSQYKEFQRIPAYGSHLAFEVSLSGQQMSVALKFQDGPGQDVKNIPLPCAPPGGDGSCSFQDFSTLAGPSSYNDASSWCSACGNTTMPVCRAAQATALAAEVATLREGRGNGGVPAWSLGVGVPLVLVVGIVAGLMLGMFLGHRKSLWPMRLESGDASTAM